MATAALSQADVNNSLEENKLNFGGDSGMREACGLFGIVATGDWPSDINLSHLIHLGLVGLQHRWIHQDMMFLFWHSLHVMDTVVYA